jgi:transcriptional regulator with XRE-family HTH domain
MPAASSPREQPQIWTVGNEIRKARKEAGMNQDQLAEAVNVSASTIWNWENGRGEPTITQFRRIAEVTNAPWLLNGRLLAELRIVPGPQRLPIDLPRSIPAPALSVVKTGR